MIILNNRVISTLKNQTQTEQEGCTRRSLLHRLLIVLPSLEELNLIAYHAIFHGVFLHQFVSRHACDHPLPLGRTNAQLTLPAEHFGMIDFETFEGSLSVLYSSQSGENNLQVLTKSLQQQDAISLQSSGFFPNCATISKHPPHLAEHG